MRHMLAGLWPELELHADLNAPRQSGESWCEWNARRHAARDIEHNLIHREEVTDVA